VGRHAVNKIHSARVRLLHPHTLFRLFKYTIYCLLTFNALLFFQEDYAASREVFSDGIALHQLTDAFSATIDTAAWLVLLLLFELETAVIPDEKLSGNLKWALMLVRAGSYTFIVLALAGYIAKYGLVSDAFAFETADVCALVGSGFTWVQDLDQYPAIDLAACAALQGQPLLQIKDTQIIGTVEAVQAIRNLAIVDIVNAANWLVIVVLLEAEVLLQLKSLLTERMVLLTKIGKGILYSILLVCAIYWGLLGDFLDFWDAFLWLVAFIFIEMNIFQWHEEIIEEHAIELESGQGEPGHAVS
jgi:hypothetical protein